MLFRSLRRAGAVLLTETGWPRAGPGSETGQVRIIGRLPELLIDLRVIGIDWALLHDVEHPAFDVNLNTVGCLPRAVRGKPGLDAFRTLRGALSSAAR